MPAERLALLLPTLGGGGAERIMVTLANELATRGFEVDLVVFTSEGPFRSAVRAPVRLVDLGTKRARASLLPLIRYLREARPKGLVASQGHANTLAVGARALANVPTRILLREENTFSVSTADSGGLARRVGPLLIRWAYHRADRVIAVSNGAARDLKSSVRLPDDAVEVIANPVAAQEIARQAAEPLDHPWFAPGQPPVVLGVGRLRPAKDFENLLRAFSRVRQRVPARLMVLGEGGERPALERLAQELGISEHVQIPGFVKNPFQYMRRAAVFVLSSRWEGLPGALIEAMACGCPVVSTDCPSGPMEILEGGRYGPLVPMGDDEKLSEAILKMLNEPTPSDTLTASVERYSVEKITDRYVELLLGTGVAQSAGGRSGRPAGLAAVAGPHRRRGGARGPNSPT